jgi:hypothetical protein
MLWLLVSLVWGIAICIVWEIVSPTKYEDEKQRWKGSW